MKKLMFTTALVAVTALSAAAQDMFRGTTDPMAISASRFIGMRVYASEAALDGKAATGLQNDWSDIGEIHDVILSRDGKVEAVLVDVGGFLGIGERQVALDMSAVKFVADDGTADKPDDFFLVVNANRANIEAAPAYGMTDAPATTETAMADGFSAADTAALTTQDLTGVTVYGSTDEAIGEISDFVMNGTDKISAVIVDVGGFLGLGAKPVALDLTEIRIMRADNGGEIRAYVPMTKDQLQSLPKADI